MLFHQGRPRYWIAGYDSAHLAVPAVLGLVIVLLAVVPTRRAAAAGTPPTPRVEPRTANPVILSPTAGAVLTPDQQTVIEGIGPAGASWQWFWFDRALGAPTLVGTDGRWRFQVQRFPPGNHVLRAATRLGDRQTLSPPVLFTVRAPVAPRPR
ncbi:MAG: hypothetical protein KIT22_01950 [Verrucomicrobiae bacterium]|nr:hypothetical protein [Verrucomicrobiae bacterium]